MHGAVVERLQCQKPPSPAGRAVHAQLENNEQGLAESTPGTTGDSGLDLGVIIHLRPSATQHVMFHFGGFSVWRAVWTRRKLLHLSCAGVRSLGFMLHKWLESIRK